MTSDQSRFFGALTGELAQRSALATVSQMGTNHRGLREHLATLLSAPPGGETSFLAPPVFENMFEWERVTETVSKLGLLNPKTVTNLEMEYAKGTEPLFPRGRRPYAHQVRAWRALTQKEPRSVLVRTGTSSGKTESFLVPILDDLTRELEEGSGQALVGVRALFLYPLNALINSQKDRLLAGAGPSGNRMRFCLYNGNTPEKLKDAERLVGPEVRDRSLLRESPPPILVTNASMLEYMLVRKVDAPILAQSQGTLRWVVLDEAHTYLGTAAAELALLIRRVLHAFGVSPSEVRFVASSATIGGADADKQLAQFLADLAGVDEQNVVVVSGRRVVPDLPADLGAASPPLLSPAELRAMDAGGRAKALASNPEFRELRERLGDNVVGLEQIRGQLGLGATDEALEILDCATEPGVEVDGNAILPLRGHYYQRTQAGIWACTSSACKGRKDTPLDAPDWPFGRIFFTRRDKCPDCDGHVGELVLCNQCGESYVFAKDHAGQLSFPSWPQGDGFNLDDGEDPFVDDDDDEDETGSDPWVLLCRRSGSRAGDGTPGMEHHFDPAEAKLGEGPRRIWVAPVTDAGLHRCGHCGEIHRPHRRIFRAARLGIPFYMRNAVQSLAERLPEEAKSAMLPGRGRRLITFTDSRQGTASHALRSQLESERMWARSTIYHHLWEQTFTKGSGSPAAVKKLETELAGLVEANKAAPSDVLAALIKEKKTKLAEAQGTLPVSIPWRAMASHLALEPTVERYMRESLVSRYGPANLDQNQLAELCLMREFLRRPARLNSLETLGLVKLAYPRLSEQVSQAPSQWLERGHTRETWLELLAFALDFFVRAHTAVDVSREVRRWLGLLFSSTLILKPGSDGMKNVSYPWPTASKTHVSRVPRTLMTALGLDTSSESDREVANGLLRRAWEDLTDSLYLKRYEQGYRLDVPEVEITPVTDGWLCPVTGRVLAHSLLGYSPFGQDRPAAPKEKCKKVQMPRPPKAYPEGDPAIEEWLASDPAVQEARSEGVWAEFSDRIVRFSDTTYLQNGEHSAQVDRATLDALEQGFRSGRVNVLHCSTTMEMGVDIGGLSGVLMNNVPPAPANYLQRAGRAGRRGETRAAVVTMCPATAHGAAVFRAPLWPFTTEVRCPKVALTSERIVQRHVHSFLLGCFLRSLEGKSGHSMDCSDFFLPGSANQDSPATCFQIWLEKNLLDDEGIKAGLASLVARTPLTGQEAQRVQLAGEELTRVATRWHDEREGILAELKEGGADLDTPWADMTPVQRAIRTQLKRHDGDFLLGHLASRGFLPAYGFPLNVVPFVTTTAEELSHEKKMREEGIVDEPGRRREYPSRGLEQALGEYAPGRDVVINGVVRQPRGVALAWRMPVGDQQGTEPQSLRFFWRCDTCGDVGDMRRSPATCPSCGQDEPTTMRYLQPAGFAVDIRDTPRNALASKPIAARRQPIVAAAGTPWQSLPTAGLGAYRLNADGWVFHYRRGENGKGYVVCRHCGRVDALERDPAGESNASRIPRAFTQHRRLRGGQVADWDDEVQCPGAQRPDQFGVWKPLALGGSNRTDVFELVLRDPEDETQPLGRSRADTVATSLAVALREALSRELGIDPRELGWSVTPGRGPVEGNQIIALYDTADGGAGYSTQGADDLHGLLTTARSVLTCPNNCDGACHACLLSFDTERHVDDLDRNAALAALTDDLLAAVRLPAELAAFGPDSRFEVRPLHDAFLLFRQRHGIKKARLYWGARVEDWDWYAWPARLQLMQLAAQGTEIEIVMPQAAVDSLDWQEGHLLSRQLEGVGFKLRVGNAPSLEVSDTHLALELEGEGQASRWAVTGYDALAPGDAWGTGDIKAQRIRWDGTTLPPTNAVERPATALAKPVPGTAKVVELAPPPRALSQFGAWLVATLDQAASSQGAGLPTGTELRSVDYSDRYLRSPLTARLLRAMLAAMSPYGLDANTTVSVRTMRADGYPGTLIWDNWANPALQKAVIEADLATLGCQAAVEIVEAKSKIAHQRVMTLDWDDGQRRRIWFDQGFGFVKATHQHFDLTATPEAQAAKLKGLDLLVSVSEPSTAWIEVL